MKTFDQWTESWFGFKKKNPRMEGEYAAAYKKLLSQFGNDEKQADAEFDKMMASPMGKYNLLKMISTDQKSMPVTDDWQKGWRADRVSGPDMMR